MPEEAAAGGFRWVHGCGYKGFDVAGVYVVPESWDFGILAFVRDSEAATCCFGWFLLKIRTYTTKKSPHYFIMNQHYYFFPPPQSNLSQPYKPATRKKYFKRGGHNSIFVCLFISLLYVVMTIFDTFPDMNEIHEHYEYGQAG